jgi:urease gamma subunit
VAAQLARRSRAEGLKLNAPETTALICGEMHRGRAGASREELLATGPLSSAKSITDGIRTIT